VFILGYDQGTLDHKQLTHMYVCIVTRLAMLQDCALNMLQLSLWFAFEPNVKNKDEWNDNGDPRKQKTFNSANIPSLLSMCDNIHNKLLECNHLVDQTLKFKMAIMTATLPYIKTYERH
jgi:hypothetical protein